jgi:DNA-binding response OmpR family regulator
LLRRSLRHEKTAQIYETEHFSVNLDEHIAIRKLDGEEEELDLTALEFNLLSAFISYPGKVWSRTQLIDKLWGADFFGDERVVDTHIRRLRKKIEPNPAQPSFVKTVVGVGYKFED